MNSGIGAWPSSLPRKFLTKWINNTDRRITVDSTLKERKAVAAVQATTGRPASALGPRLRAAASVGIVHRDLAEEAADGATDTWRASGDARPSSSDPEPPLVAPWICMLRGVNGTTRS